MLRTKKEMKRSRLPEKALSTALAGMLAMSVGGTSLIAFATETDRLEEEERTTVGAVLDGTTPSVEESVGAVPPVIEGDAEVPNTEEAETFSAVFATEHASIVYADSVIEGQRAVNVPVDEPLVFMASPEEGYAIDDATLQVLNEGIIEELAAVEGPTGYRYEIAPDALADGMAIVVTAAPLPQEEQPSDTSADEDAIEEAEERETADPQEDPTEKEPLSESSAANARSVAFSEDETISEEVVQIPSAPAYKTVDVRFVSRDAEVSVETVRAGSFVTMPAAPEGVTSYEQTIYACKDANGQVRRTASLEKAKTYASYETETITYTFFGWSNRQDYGSLSTAKDLYDTLQQNNLYQVGENVFCDGLTFDAQDTATLYAVWKQTGGPYFAGESIDTDATKNLGGDGVYRISITLLHNSTTVPVEPSVLSVGYPVKDKLDPKETGKYFTILYRDVVGNVDGTNPNDPSVGQYNTLGRKLVLEELVSCAMTTAGEQNVTGILTDEFYATVNSLNDNGDGTYNYWDPATQRVMWYVVKEQLESYWGADTMYKGWHFDGMVVDLDDAVEGGDDPNGRPASYALRYDANCGDSLGALPLSTVHTASPNDEGILSAEAPVADPSDDVYVANNAAGEAVFTAGLSRPGHTFLGWAALPVPGPDDVVYQPGDTIVLTGNTTLYAQWDRAAGSYTVNHYLQNASGGYDLAHTAAFDAKVGDEVRAVPNAYDLYELNAGLSTLTGTVLASTASGNSLVLDVYYDRAMPQVKVTAPSAKKVYDGTPLLPGEPTVEGQIPDGYTVEVTVEGTQTDVGTSPSRIGTVIVRDPFGNDVTDLFDPILVEGTLTVVPQSVDPAKGPGNPGEPTDPDDPNGEEHPYKGVTIEPPTDVDYNAGDQKRRPIVKDSQGNVLVEGRDYELEFPSGDFKNAGEVPVIVKGKGNYTDEFQVSYNIRPIPVEIVVDSVTKVYGEDDPTFTGAVSGLLGDDVLGDVVFDRTNDAEEVGTYELVLNASVTNANRNYVYTVRPGTFSITPANSNNVNISANAEDNEKIYDGEPITVNASADAPGSTLHYYTEGMDGWSTEPPLFTNVGTYAVLVKATNPNYEETAVVTAHVVVNPASVVITVADAEKALGEADPVFTGDIRGLVPGDELGTIVYFRTNNGIEDEGVYADALSALVQHRNGNYVYTVVPGTFTIKAADARTPIVSDDPDDPRDPAGLVDPERSTDIPSAIVPGDPVTALIEMMGEDAVATIVDPLATLRARIDAADDLQAPNPGDEPSIVDIADDETPLAAFSHDGHACWIHPWMILGLLLTALFGLGAIGRRERQVMVLDDMVEDACVSSTEETAAAPEPSLGRA